MNGALAEFAPRFGVELDDWCSSASQHIIVLCHDGIHYPTAACPEDASFWAAALAGALPSVTADGSRRCQLTSRRP
jgi:hypothetical protein